MPGGADTVIAEAVGSCTDLQATVVRPLRREHGDALAVAPLTAIIDPGRYRLFARAWDAGSGSDLAYLYAHQLAEADVIAVNKTDTVTAPQLHALLVDIARRYPGARVVRCCAAGGELGGLLDCLFPVAGEPPGGPRAATAVPVDYDRYAAAEAELAWLNHAVAITATTSAGFGPADWAAAALTAISGRFAAAGALVGHAKIIVTTAGGAAKASVTASGGPVQLDVAAPPGASTGRGVINLRVACSPDDLDRAAVGAVRAADRASHTHSVPEPGTPAFRPAYPRPAHRVLSDYPE
jgi:hypothetical protein